jgi:hypothetical protein
VFFASDETPALIIQQRPHNNKKTLGAENLCWNFVAGFFKGTFPTN